MRRAGGRDWQDGRPLVSHKLQNSCCCCCRCRCSKLWHQLVLCFRAGGLVAFEAGPLACGEAHAAHGCSVACRCSALPAAIAACCRAPARGPASAAVCSHVHKCAPLPPASPFWCRSPLCSVPHFSFLSSSLSSSFLTPLQHLSHFSSLSSSRCSYLQKRVLNSSKGPAVWALRAQTDKLEYAASMRRVLETTPNLSIREGAPPGGNTVAHARRRDQQGSCMASRPAGAAPRRAQLSCPLVGPPARRPHDACATCAVHARLLVRVRSLCNRDDSCNAGRRRACKCGRMRPAGCPSKPASSISHFTLQLQAW